MTSLLSSSSLSVSFADIFILDLVLSANDDDTKLWFIFASTTDKNEKQRRYQCSSLGTKFYREDTRYRLVYNVLWFVSYGAVDQSS